LGGAISPNVSGAGDVAPAFGAQCGVARGAQRRALAPCCTQWQQ